MENRIELAKYFNKLGFKKGAEIGVADGRYSEILCQKIPRLELLCVDPFYRAGHFEKTIERLDRFNVNIVRKTSIEAVIEVPDESLDFVFIDGNHTFDYVMEDLINWARKVRKGGIVSGHDYYQFHGSGVIEAVYMYCQIHNIELKLTDWYKGGHKDDRAPCWYFIK